MIFLSIQTVSFERDRSRDPGTPRNISSSILEPILEKTIFFGLQKNETLDEN